MWSHGTALLARAECLELIGGVRVGRVAVSVGALPAIIPVDYVLVGEDVVVRAQVGRRLGAALTGNVVAFEVDAADADGDMAWTVQVVGRSEPVLDRAIVDALARRSPAPRAARGEDHVVRINARDVTGRRFDLSVEHVTEG